MDKENIEFMDNTVNDEVPDNNDKTSNNNENDVLTLGLAMSYYEKELERINTLTLEETDEYAQELLYGSETARNALIEANLPLVKTIAQSFSDNGLPMEDLIQEGNLALVMAVNSYNGEVRFDEHIITAISEAMQEALGAENISTDISGHLLEIINQISVATQHIAEKEDRQPTLSELSKLLKISEDEVRIAMKISLDAMTRNDLNFEN